MSHPSALRANTPIRADTIVIVFARAPIAGRVKTRLAPILGAPRAARLHTRLIAHAMRTAREARCGPVELHLTQRHALFPYARTQTGRDLGERMQHALRGALRRHRRALLIGADVPALAPADLRRARRLLQGGTDVVLAPAEDGGFGLIGARRARLGLFRDVRWGRDTVLAETLRNASLAGLRCRLLRTVWDLDRPEDLARLRSRPLSSAFRRGARR
ncbi:MAG TPA: TIGR04282 family arsenosugar biosynthesis glycosyltransferase [Burkholderiales bacterium]|nr:TIGR04282 family arsenosugar biosynthesis glycosyltransferase [Burkholderiales bacterium]